MAKVIHRSENVTQKKVKNDFKKEFFKLMIKSVFVKTIESLGSIETSNL